MKLIPIALLLAAAAAPAALRAQSPEPAADLADTLRAVDMAAVDQLPLLATGAEVARSLAALYPESLRASGVSGTVRVRFVVDARGWVLAPRVAKASGHAALDSAALRVAQAMRFSPARQGGKPQPVWVELPLSFQAPAPGAEGAPAAGGVARVGPDSAGAVEMWLAEELPELNNRNVVHRAIQRAYPPALKDRGVTGTVTLRLIVDTLGVPGEVRVVESTEPELHAAAVQVAQVMRFRPARIGGRKVRVWVTIPIRFQPQ